MIRQKIIKIMSAIILFTMIFIGTNNVNAAEELPDNGAKISSAQIIQTKTGTGPFDDNDDPGNDSSEDNNIVRSFDQVTWTVENTMVLNGDSNISYTGGTIYVKLSLPESAKGMMHWDKDSMGWAENTGVLSEDGLTFTAQYNMSKSDSTIPGKQTLIFVLKIDGASNNYEINPEFELYLNGNPDEDKKKITPDKITVSSKPSYNIRLLRRDLKRKNSIIENGETINGIVYGYILSLQLYNPNTSKGMKGIEYPKGDIKFDLDLNLEKYDKQGNLIENITNSYTPKIYNYLTNAVDSVANVFYKDRTYYGFLQEAYTPLSNRVKFDKATQAQKESYIYKCGNMKMEQDGSVIHVTISDYDFDGVFPQRNSGTQVGTVNYTPNIGFFSTLMFQLLVPIDESSGEESCNYFFTVKDQNLDITSISGQKNDTQVRTNDDTIRTQVEVFTPGNYYKHHQFYDANLRNMHSPSWNSGDVYVSIGQTLYLTQMVCQGRVNDPIEHAVYGGNILMKIDDKTFEVLPEYNGSKFRADGGWFTFDMYYAAKKDGSGWVDLNEQDDAKIEDLVYYRTLEELEADGKICVGALFENNGGIFKTGENQNSNLDKHIFLPVRVKQTAAIGETAQHTSDVRLYKEALDRTTESMIIENGKYTTKAIYSSYNNNYIKAEYDENGQIISGTHSSTGAGNSALIVGAKTTIVNDVNMFTEENKKKINFDISRNEYEIEYKLSPVLVNDYIKTTISGISVEVLDILPLGMKYKSGSSNYGEPEIISNSDGTTTLKWVINNCTANQKIDPIIFSALINEELSNGTQLETTAQINSTIDNSLLKFRTEKENIQITNLSSHRLYKIDTTPVIEKNGEIHYTLSYKNNTDENIPDFQLLDILPYNGDSRETEYTGTYTLDRLVVTQEGIDGNKLSNDNLKIMYTDDESVRERVTCKDDNLGDTWKNATSETIKNKATAIALKGEIGAQGKVTVDIYLKTNGNKGLDKYVNNATAQVYKETEQMTTSNVISQVVERKIEGIAWEDKNANGIKDENEEIFKNIEITLTDAMGEQVIDVNGNIVTSVKTDNNGHYVFENLPKGNYYVKISVPNSKYELTEKEVGSNTEINSKFNTEALETDEITKLNSIDLPELTVSYVNAGLVKKPTKVIVKYKEIGTEDVLHEEVTIDGRIDDTYETENKLDTINEKYLNKYKYVKVDGNTTGIMTEDIIYVTYWYEKKDTNVKVLHVLEGTDVSHPESVTDVLYKTEEKTGKVDSDYTTQNRLNEINNNSKVKYELVTDDVENKNGKMQVDTIYVVYEYKTIPAKVKVNHLELNTNTILYSQETLDGLVGNDYTTQNRLNEINNLNENKYELVTPEPTNKNGTFEKKEQEVTYYYQKKMAEIEVNYLEVGTEKVLSEKVTESERIDTPYTTENKLTQINEENDNKYEFVEVAGNAEGVYTLDKQVITYYYQKKMAEIEVNYLEVGTEKVLSEKVIESERIDTPYTTENKLTQINEENDNKYEFVEVVGNAEGVYTLDKQVITYYYQKKMAEIEVNYLEVGTEKVLSEKIIENERIDTPYTTENKLTQINEENDNKYEFVEVVGNAEGVYTLDKQVITYYYQKKDANVKVLHVEEGTDVSVPENVSYVLYETEEIKGRIDDPYETSDRLSEINTNSKIQYELVSVTENANGNMTLDTQYVIYVYRKVPASIIVRHLDIDSKEELLKTKTEENYVGEDYTTENKLQEINDIYENKYELVSEPENKNGVYKKEEQEIVYYYQKKPANIVVKYVDIDTDEELVESVNIPGKVDDEYVTEDKIEEINETLKNKYVLVKTTDNIQGNMTIDEIEVIYYYKKVESQVIVKYIDDKTQEEIAKKEYLGGFVGDEYETSPKDIEGYELIVKKIPTNKNGIYEEETIEVIYYYSRIQVPVDTGDINVIAITTVLVLSILGIAYITLKNKKSKLD